MDDIRDYLESAKHAAKAWAMIVESIERAETIDNGHDEWGPADTAWSYILEMYPHATLTSCAAAIQDPKAAAYHRNALHALSYKVAMMAPRKPNPAT